MSQTIYVENNKLQQHNVRQRMFVKVSHFALDLTVLVAAFALAYLLRFDFALDQKDIYQGLVQLPYVVLIQITALALTGVYSFIWRYVGFAEFKVFSLAAVVSVLPLLLLRFGLSETYDNLRVPLSIIVMDTTLAFVSIVGLRVLRRFHYERYEILRKRSLNGAPQKKPVLLIGAGRAGVIAAREILSSGDVELEVKGFVDDDPKKKGSVIHGIRVLGTTDDLPRLVFETQVDHVVISIAQANRQEFRRILDICESVPVKVRTIPGLSEILQGKVKISRIRDLEVEDLLGRSPVQLDAADMNGFLVGKTVLVTGAGGSIGSELARQVARFEPAQLLLVERAEFALFNIERELRETYPQVSLHPLVADIGDVPRMRSIFETHRPQVIVHAAAHKHVPMMEVNPTEAIKNNTLATHQLGELAGEYEAEAFVLISTDKAVRPTSVMGASKRVAELLVQNLNRSYSTRYAAVRFGNVMGSTGSVIPIFREQIRKGGPVTVTHPDMVRYFMTISEAAQLVLQAGAMCAGGEIFILDMGEPVKILDLAEDTISLSGLKPYEDIEIKFTGIRAGEKLAEELDTKDEAIAKTRHPKIFIGEIKGCSPERLHHALQHLPQLAEHGNGIEIRAFLGELLPESQLNLLQENRTALQNSDIAQPQIKPKFSQQVAF